MATNKRRRRRPDGRAGLKTLDDLLGEAVSDDTVKNLPGKGKPLDLSSYFRSGEEHRPLWTDRADRKQWTARRLGVVADPADSVRPVGPHGRVSRKRRREERGRQSGVGRLVVRPRGARWPDRSSMPHPGHGGAPDRPAPLIRGLRDGPGSGSRAPAEATRRISDRRGRRVHRVQGWGLGAASRNRYSGGRWWRQQSPPRSPES